MADNWVLLYNGSDRVQDVAAGSQQQTAIRDSTLFSDFVALIEAPEND